MQALLERFIVDAPSPEYKLALRSASLVKSTTETLLAALLDKENPQAEFNWLRGLTFIQDGLKGVFPHDIVREVLVSDLQWRDPNSFERLHKRARKYCMAQLRDAESDTERREALSDVFLFRTNPIVKPFLGTLNDRWKEVGQRITDSYQPADFDILISMVEQFEGAESAEHARYWLAEYPEATQVFRDENGVAKGFLMTLELDQLSEKERAFDSAVSSVWRYLENEAPLRENERTIFFRFWMDSEVYQGISAVQSLIFSSMVRKYLITPGLAFSFLPCEDAELWSTMFAFARIHRLENADYKIGDKEYAIFGHDWRAKPIDEWMSMLASQAPKGAPADSGPNLRKGVLVFRKPHVMP